MSNVNLYESVQTVFIQQLKTDDILIHQMKKRIRWKVSWVLTTLILNSSRTFRFSILPVHAMYYSFSWIRIRSRVPFLMTLPDISSKYWKNESRQWEIRKYSAVWRIFNVTPVQLYAQIENVSYNSDLFIITGPFQNSFFWEHH